MHQLLQFRLLLPQPPANSPTPVNPPTAVGDSTPTSSYVRPSSKKASRQRGVCVNHLNRCKTSTLIGGIAFPYQVLCHYNEPVLEYFTRRLSNLHFRCRGSPCFLDDFPTSLNRWCGPMQAAILHSQNMPCPQFRPQWATNQSGPYMMGRTMNPIPSMTQGTWSGHRFPPAPRFHCYILPQGTYKSLATSRAVAAQNGLAAAGRVCETSEQM